MTLSTLAAPTAVPLPTHPSDAPAPAAPRSASFAAIGTANRVLTTRPETLGPALAIAREHLAELDAAVSRFRPDSEVSSLARRAQNGPAWAYVSATFAHYLDRGLHAARLTGGLVDATIGAALVQAGYDVDLDVVRARRARPTRSADLVIHAPPALRPDLPDHPGSIPGWRAIQFDPLSRRVVAPQGTLIDLGASAKAAAADRIADLLAAALPGGFLVNLGGDIASSGELPVGGWDIGVESADGRILQVVSGTGQAFATSSTQKRTWATADAAQPDRHHILDPRTGRSAQTRWAQVTCAAVSALEANAASTAAIILDGEAPAWLAKNGIPARLDTLDGAVVTTPGWTLEARA